MCEKLFVKMPPPNRQATKLSQLRLCKMLFRGVGDAIGCSGLERRVLCSQALNVCVMSWSFPSSPSFDSLSERLRELLLRDDRGMARSDARIEEFDLKVVIEM